MVDRSKLTPVMQQYMDIKDDHRDAILFFRLGDFYEMFFKDAEIASDVLDITLTSRDKKSDDPIPMAGVPYHSAASYINRLIKKGYKVCICEQTSKPGETKIVEREAVQIITPGTVLDEEALNGKSNNYVMSVFYSGEFYIAYSDLSTGEFNLERTESEELFPVLCRIMPSEVLLDRDNIPWKTLMSIQKNFYITGSKDKGSDPLERDIFSEIRDPFLKKAGEMLYGYLEETQKGNLHNIGRVRVVENDNILKLDVAAQKNLELIDPMIGEDNKATLFGVLDHTNTAMGGRKLRKWILTPLTDVKEISCRADCIEFLYENSLIRRELNHFLKRIRDIERLINRISLSGNNPRDLVSLRESIKAAQELKSVSRKYGPMSGRIDAIFDLSDLTDLLERAIQDDPPVRASDGNFIKDGFDEKLDELREISGDSRKWLASLEMEEKEKTGIKNLKVKYNKVFGYFIEVSKSNIDRVPENYIRKQTMSNSERYFTPELKEKEAFILGSKERIQNIENRLYKEVREETVRYYGEILEISDIIAELDCLLSLSIAAFKNKYSRPEILDERIIEINDGRHPVVEKVMEEDFIPNDCIMGSRKEWFHIITGPNMAGKSTYIRQIALIVLMAQMGSFVPASYAKIGIHTRIFTRIGASDNLSMGQSTFMVEMSETAQILKNCDEKSLVILDEIGRGTSTYDGLSIAWAVTEYLHSIGSFTLFATHYHELTFVEKYLDGIKNYNVAIIEEGDELVFLHKIVDGSADRSYGIHVADIAGVPSAVIKRAQQLLDKFENSENRKQDDEEADFSSIRLIDRDTLNDQLDLFKEKTTEKYFKYGEAIALVNELKKLDINNTTPLNALNKLNKLRKKARKL